MREQLFVQHIDAHEPLHRGISLIDEVVSQTGPGVITHRTKIQTLVPLRDDGREVADLVSAAGWTASGSSAAARDDVTRARAYHKPATRPSKVRDSTRVMACRSVSGGKNGVPPPSTTGWMKIWYSSTRSASARAATV